MDWLKELKLWHSWYDDIEEFRFDYFTHFYLTK